MGFRALGFRGLRGSGFRDPKHVGLRGLGLLGGTT